MEKIDFTKKEENIIAEYGYSYSTDVLIKSDAVDVLVVMIDHKMITDLDAWLEQVENQADGIAHKIIRVLRYKIPQEQRREIMNNYMGNYKSPLKVTEGL